MDERLRRLIPKREHLQQNRWLRWLGPYFHHPRLWHWSRRGVAMGVALGVFFGLLVPIAQIPLSAAAAVLLRANVPAAAASTLVTNPVTFGPIYYAAYHLGAWVTGQEARPKALEKSQAAVDEENLGVWQRLRALGLPLLVGLAIAATLMGLASYGLISLVWYLRVMRKRRQGRRRKSQPEA
ncbi:MAG: DUF2062 domain-containing protein [Thiobacillus sp.]|nr:DUF2062 domain-containing protein [Thiobacillus sp.]